MEIPLEFMEYLIPENRMGDNHSMLPANDIENREVTQNYWLDNVLNISDASYTATPRARMGILKAL